VTLLVSDTPAAAWVADVTRALLPNVLGRQATVELRQVPRLSPESMRSGLVEFIRVSARAIKDCRSRRLLPIINATPGFKAEAALLTLEGALLGAESFYLHEQMQSIVAVPAIPLRWGLEESDINLLRKIGGAVNRDRVRDLGIAQFPHLESFIAREGLGAEEIWGLSALGELLVESMGGVEEEEPPERGAEHAEILIVERERPNMPEDAEQLAQQVGDQFRFVKKVQVFRFFRRRYRQGVLPPRDDDVNERVVRLRLHSNSSKGDRPQALGVRLYTTADTDGQYREVVRCLGNRYGEINLSEYLIEEEIEEAEKSGRVVVESELAALAIEGLLKSALDRRQADYERLVVDLANVRETLDRAQRSLEGLNAQLQRANEQKRELKTTIKNQRASISELQQKLDSVTAASSAGCGDDANGRPQ
jgi:putative CRISPR-associated protein (TIGR02619 family)